MQDEKGDEAGGSRQGALYPTMGLELYSEGH